MLLCMAGVVYIYFFPAVYSYNWENTRFVDSTRYGPKEILHASTMVMPYSEMVVK